MRIPKIRLLVLFLLSACTIATTPSLPAAPSPSLSPQESPQPTAFWQPSPSPLPSPHPFPRLTASPLEIENWRQIQTALAERLQSWLPPQDVLCEWEILGRESGLVFVWARCSSLTEIGQVNPGYSTAEMPAVLHLSADGTVEDVEIPGIGSHYASSIRALFPVDVQTIIFDDLIDYARLSQHLCWRLSHPDEPPLNVIESAP